MKFLGVMTAYAFGILFAYDYVLTDFSPTEKLTFACL